MSETPFDHINITMHKDISKEAREPSQLSLRDIEESLVQAGDVASDLVRSSSYT
jgi:hypothetical protein